MCIRDSKDPLQLASYEIAGIPKEGASLSLTFLGMIVSKTRDLKCV